MRTPTIPQWPLTTFTKPLGQVWHAITNLVSHRPDVRVWQRTDRFGQVGWHGYDPISGDYVCYGTEDEIRSWIEQRYYTREWD